MKMNLLRKRWLLLSVCAILMLLTILSVLPAGAAPVYPATGHDSIDLEDEGVELVVDDFSRNSFWGFFVMIGFLVPIAPFTVGLVFANSAKMGHPKRWYLLSGLAALWIITSVLLMIVLLL